MNTSTERKEPHAASQAPCQSGERQGRTWVVEMSGVWKFDRGCPVPADALPEGDVPAGLEDARIEAAAVSGWDTALLIHIRALQQAFEERNLRTAVAGLPDGARRLLDLAAAVPEREGARRNAKRMALPARVGTAALRVFGSLAATITFLGDVTIALGRFLTGRAQYRKADFLGVLHECSWGALPIVCLISFLVGLVLAFVGALQLTMFGAEIFVADLVGVGVAVEMGALMTGIIMSGRTGAAFAAQIGTMQVNEEVDALRTMGISPVEFLVMPRMLALILMMPLLCMFADLVGMLGGAVVGIGVLDITPVQYFNQTFSAVRLNHFAQGLIKSAVFGVLIAFAGCWEGIRCGRSASAVGQATTAAVVSCIVWIVVSDALLTVIYRVVGL